MKLLSRCHWENVGSSKEKRIWVIRAREIKAKRNSRKRLSSVRRKNEKRKKKRRTNKCPVLSGDLCVLSAGCWCSTTSWRSDWQPAGGRGRPGVSLSAGESRSAWTISIHAGRCEEEEASSGNEPAWATPRRIISGRPLLTTTIRLFRSNAVASRPLCRDNRWPVSPSSNSNRHTVGVAANTMTRPC